MLHRPAKEQLTKKSKERKLANYGNRVRRKESSKLSGCTCNLALEKKSKQLELPNEVKHTSCSYLSLPLGLDFAVKKLRRPSSGFRHGSQIISVGCCPVTIIERLNVNATKEQVNGLAEPTPLHVHHAFFYILCSHGTTTTWKYLISRFLEAEDTRRWLSFSFLVLRDSSLEFNSRKNLPTFDELGMDMMK